MANPRFVLFRIKARRVARTNSCRIKDNRPDAIADRSILRESAAEGMTCQDNVLTLERDSLFGNKISNIVLR